MTNQELKHDIHIIYIVFVCVQTTYEIGEIHETLDGIVALFFKQLGFGNSPAGQAPLKFPGKVVDMSDRFHRLAGRFCACGQQRYSRVSII